MVKQVDRRDLKFDIKTTVHCTVVRTTPDNGLSVDLRIEYDTCLMEDSIKVALYRALKKHFRTMVNAKKISYSQMISYPSFYNCDNSVVDLKTNGDEK